MFLSEVDNTWTSRDYAAGQHGLFPLFAASYSNSTMTNSMSSEAPDIYLLSLTWGDMPVFEVCTPANHTMLDYFLTVVLHDTKLQALICIFSCGRCF